MSSKVVLKGHSGAQYKEGVAQGAITPGMLVRLPAAGQVAVQNQVGPVSARVAIENHWVGGDINTNYVLNDQVVYQVLQPGAEFNALLAAGAAAVAFGDVLESAGDGTVRKATKGGQPASIQVGAAPNGLVKGVARIGGADMNEVTLQILAASGGGTVVVTNNAIVVTPAAAGDNATAVVAQLNANAVTSEMATWTVPSGSGAASTGVVAATNFTGGINEVQRGAGTLICRQAVDNSGGATTARVRVEVE